MGLAIGYGILRRSHRDATSSAVHRVKEERMKESRMNKPSVPRPSRTRTGPKKEFVLFEYFDPSSKIVALVGDFNQWNPSIRPMKRDGGGLWKVKVLLAPGSYQYKFVVNGDRWEEDPLNLHRIMNEHGTYNSIRTVGTGSDSTVGPTT